jgi:branched-subunit amino acid aminotransferase/4-amino-4-deoxychorismate lyase
VAKFLRVEVNGRPATVEQLTQPAVLNYGHFTVMLVRGGRAQGLGLHLDRLVAATRELFDAPLDPDLVQHHIRQALADTPDAYVRVNVFQLEDEPAVMVSVRPPPEPPAAPVRLRSVRYQRPVPHVKHVGSFAQIYHGERARRDGFDDALLVGADGTVSETSTGNLAVLGSDALIWPDGPHLAGITMQLLAGAVPSRRAAVRLADAPSFAAALVTNSISIAAVAAIDGVTIPVDTARMRTVHDAYAAVAWDVI